MVSQLGERPAVVKNNGELFRPLEAYVGARPPAPEWFLRAQAEPCSRIGLAVAGCELELLCWGEVGKPGILLLHGSMAHAQWWTAIAPMLAKDYRVCSLSFSGMGGSGHRERYSITQMAQEAWAAIEAGGLFDGPVLPMVASHSFGGKAASLMAGRNGGERLLGVMFVDSFVIPLTDGREPPPYRSRFYPTEAEALARFRLSPDQPGGEPYMIDAIARAGVHQRADGQWSWRFDPDFFHKLEYVNSWDELLHAQCRLAFLRGEHSDIVTPAEEAMQRQLLRQESLYIEIPAAHHHIMIDQPLALLSAMRGIAAAWIKQGPV